VVARTSSYEFLSQTQSSVALRALPGQYIAHGFVVSGSPHSLRRYSTSKLIGLPRNSESLRNGMQQTYVVSVGSSRTSHTPTRLTPSCSSPAPSGSPRMISMSTCHMISHYPHSRSLDPTKVSHTGTRDRIFTSGKVLVYTHVCVTLQSNGSKYSIPGPPWGCSSGGVLHFVCRANACAGECFSNTPAHTSDRLEFDFNDMRSGGPVALVAEVTVRLQFGWKRLSLRCWHSLEKMVIEMNTRTLVLHPYPSFPVGYLALSFRSSQCRSVSIRVGFLFS
jgi:hypothetical protein